MEEVIYYSLFNKIDERICSALSLLYDRAIIPFTDFASSPHPWATEFVESCSAIRPILENTQCLRSGKAPVCRSLEASDSHLMDTNSNGFNEVFHDFRRNQGISDDQWVEAIDKSLYCAYAMLNCFLTADILSAKEGSTILICADRYSYSAEKVEGALATALGVELENFAMPRVEFAPDKVAEVRERTQDLQTRIAFRQEMLRSGRKVAEELKQATDGGEKKAIIRDELERLKGLYWDFLQDIRHLQRNGIVKLVKDPSNNLVFLIKPHFRLKAGVKTKIPGWGEFYIEAERDRTYLQTVLHVSEIRQYLQGGIAWQKHLLAIQSAAEEAFGMKSEFVKKTLRERVRDIFCQ